MRRILMLVLCCLMLVTPAFAANRANQIQTNAVVSPDGSCQVSCIVSVTLDEPKTNLTFPIPAKATDVTVNGASARARKNGEISNVDLKFLSGFTGTYSLTFLYTLPNVVVPQEDGKLMVELPLLSGFPLGVDNMDFSVTLPGDIKAVPAFTSGYYQESIEASMECTVEGNTISGVMIKPLLDSETMKMTLEVPPEMFRMTVSTDAKSPIFPILMGVSAALALIYWIIFLRCLPLRRNHCALPPEGVSAGELCSRLVGNGADLTMMVVSWAQLGYLIISRDDSGRVFLHKRMEMGNERSKFENHCYRSLFGRKRMIDGTGYHYAKLWLKIADDKSNVRGQYLTKSGNPNIFRALGGGIMLFAGAALGASLSSSTPWKILLLILFGTLGAFSGWKIQGGCCCFHLRNRLAGIIGLSFGAVWLFAGLLSGLNGLIFPAVLSQILVGFAAAFGGRRTDTSRQIAGEILGLRSYLKKTPRQEFQRILSSNPDYYYEMAPYALALGVDKKFAGQLGRTKLPDCPYLLTTADANTALQWYLLLRDTVGILDARHKRLKIEKMFKV